MSTEPRVSAEEQARLDALLRWGRDCVKLGGVPRPNRPDDVIVTLPADLYLVTDALADSREECARLRERVEAAEKERDELAERCEAFEDAVRESLPEITGDADGNLETNEIARIESVAILYDEARRHLAEADAALLYTWGHDDTASLDATVRAAVRAARARQAEREKETT